MYFFDFQQVTPPINNLREAELKKIETVRLKFAAADLSSIKKNSFDQKKDHWRTNQRRDQSEERANKESANEKRETKKVQEAPKTTNYYRALPTVSGLKLDQSLLSKLCEMGFDRALATQGMGLSVSRCPQAGASTCRSVHGRGHFRTVHR